MSAQERRQQGITLTPPWLVQLMLDRVALAGPFDTIVDPGAGTGHFCIAAARRLAGVRVVAIEKSEEMLAGLRLQVHAAGVADRVQVVQGDFRDAPWAASGRCAYVGNPPFVRHHDIDPHWKQWYGQVMTGLGLKASQLAGLHLHFLARIGQRVRAGDFVCLVTSAEWLDNGYGSAWRALLSRDNTPLGLTALWVADPAAPVFPDALVSAAVLEARARTEDGPVTLGLLGPSGLIPSRVCRATDLAACARWSGLCQPELLVPAAGVEVGELFKVTRGQVTGLNEAWVLGPDTTDLPHSLTLPMVTRAREIIDGTVQAPDALQRLKRVPCCPKTCPRCQLRCRPGCGLSWLVRAPWAPQKAMWPGRGAPGTRWTCVSPRPPWSATWGGAHRFSVATRTGQACSTLPTVCTRASQWPLPRCWRRWTT